MTDKEKWLRPSDATIKIGILRSVAGLPQFGIHATNRALEHGRHIHGFYRFADGVAAPVEETDYTAFETQKMSLKSGGTIVFGLTMDVSDADLVQQVELYLPDLIKEAIGEVVPENIGWTIGNLGHGHWVAPGGQHFDERSTTVTIRGVPSDVLEKIGQSLMAVLNQFAVLIVDDNANDTYLLERKSS